jgi:hypothetical protein
LYLGERLISGGDVVLTSASLSDLADVIVDETKANSFLVQNAEGKWDNVSLEDVAALIKEAMGEIAAPANVFQVTKEETDADDIAAIGRVSADATLAAGDIAIVKKLIVAADAERGTEARYEYTAYVYNSESQWAAMDGNYNAENVYFNDDLTFTANIGALTLASGKTKGTYEAKGKSLEEVIKGIMAKTIPPTIKQPSYSLDSVTADKGTSVEIGTKITKLNWAATFNDGTYSYKSTQAPTSTSAGCTATYEMSCTLPGKTAGEGYTTSDADKQDGTLTLNNAFQVTSTSAETVGTINTTCKISDSPRTPLNNIGDEVDGRIINVADKTGSKSFSVTGYRAWFCGYKNGTNALADATAITGDQVRALGNSANGSWKSEMEVSQLKQMFFAAPAGTGSKPSVKDKATTAPQTVQGPITVYVKGANDYVAAGDETTNGGMAYDVWYVNNADAASGSATLVISR